MARDTWYRLDNVGKFYSSQAGSSAQTVFRFSATLVDEVDPEVLQLAVEKTVDLFPGFNVCLRSGMFWHYLEQAREAPPVHLENLPICYGLHVDTKSILFRVSYYHDRINFEVSHIVSDGRGSLNFFKALLSHYIPKRYGIEEVIPEYDGSDMQKSENSFDKYFERDKTSSASSDAEKAAARTKPRVYRLTGWRDEADPTYIEYHLPSKKVRELARSYGVSVTSLIIAVLMLSIRCDMAPRDHSRLIRVKVPVDLRQMFGSATTKNFFGLTSVSSVLEQDISVPELARQVQEQLDAATTPEQLKPRMNRMIALEKNPFLRYAPLFVKDIALEWADYLTSRETTTTVSNLGLVTLDDRLSPFVRDMNILTSSTGLNFTLCSFGDDLSIGISTIFSNLDLIKHFCRFFSAQEIYGHLNINKTSEEVAADWREARIETSVKRLGGQLPPSEDDAEDALLKPEISMDVTTHSSQEEARTTPAETTDAQEAARDGGSDHEAV